MAIKFRIYVKEVWLDACNKHLETCWVEKFSTIRAARKRVHQIRTTDKWDCVGDWRLEVEGGIEPYEVAQ